MMPWRSIYWRYVYSILGDREARQEAQRDEHFKLNLIRARTEVAQRIVLEVEILENFVIS
jgi:hypothetical protein